MSTDGAEDLTSAAAAVLGLRVLVVLAAGATLFGVLEWAAFPVALLAIARVWPRALAAAAWTLRHLCRRRDAWPLQCRAYALADLGHDGAAAQAALDLLVTAKRRSPSLCPWSAVNSAVDVLVNAGRYDEAAQATARWSPAEQQAGREAEPGGYVFTQINLAEALHNQGRDTEALALLDRVEPQAQGDGLAADGSKLLRAWILVHGGQAEAARVALGEPRPAVLGPRYRAEMHYTQAAVERELGNLDEARRQAAMGLACARRAASQRNGLQSLAAVAFARGDVPAAVTHLEAFARDRLPGAIWRRLAVARPIPRTARPHRRRPRRLSAGHRPRRRRRLGARGAGTPHPPRRLNSPSRPRRLVVGTSPAHRLGNWSCP